MARTSSTDHAHAGAFALGIRILIIAVTAAAAAAPASATAPETVSPGAADRVATTRTECPTFSWGAVEGAAHFEILVYGIPDGTTNDGDLELSPDDEVLYARIPGGATSWTPELNRCLEPGGRYVWFVRAAVAEDGTVAAAEWSEGRFFSVAAMPAAAEVEHALEVLRRYAVQGGAEAATIDGPDRDAGAARPRGARRFGGPGADELRSVPVATAAIRGSSPDTTGEVYGVAGLSSSPDGAGIAAANLNNGPDLVLDGSADLEADARLSQSGIDRPSASAQAFTFTNTGGGGIVVEIDGSEVITAGSDLDAGKLASGTVPDGRLAGAYSQALALTNPGNAFTGSGANLAGVDADTLDGIDSTAFATDAEAAALVAVHAASADHDGRYFTETELATSGASSVHWDNLTSVPAGFADGIDDVGSFTAGPGIIVDGSEVRIDWAALQTSRSTPDSGGNVGAYTSVAIGTDGLGLISYFDSTDFDLKVAHCNDTACSTATTATLDSGGNVGAYSSIAIGSDGLGLISYFDSDNADLKVAHCNDTACSTASVYTLDSGGNVGAYSSIAIGTDGFGLISYYDGTITRLKVAHCVNVVCTSAAKYSIDNVGDVGTDSSIAIGADGFGLIAYRDYGNGDLKVAHCNDTACSTAAVYILDSTGDVGGDTSIAIGADGRGLISYQDVATAVLKVAHCNNTPCGSAEIFSLDRSGLVGYDTSIAIGPDGLGLISHYDASNQDLKVARCDSTSCSSVTSAAVDHLGVVGLYTSIAIGADGLGLISYQDSTNGDLKVAHLGIGVP